MITGFRRHVAGQTVRRLKLLCQKTSHHLIKLNNLGIDGWRTTEQENSSAPPLLVWVTTVTRGPSWENSSASKALTVSSPPMLGAKACDESKIFKMRSATPAYAKKASVYEE